MSEDSASQSIIWKKNVNKVKQYFIPGINAYIQFSIKMRTEKCYSEHYVQYANCILSFLIMKKKLQRSLVK